MTSEDFVEVFKGAIAEADLIKFILEEAGMSVWLENEATGAMLTGVVSPGGGDIVKVLVAPDDAEKARDEIKRSEQDETTTD